MRIAISQRVEYLEDREERRDCLDQAWPSLLDEIGYDPIPLPNTLSDPVAWVQLVNAEAFLLTGGNDLAHVPGADNPAPERDRTERQILQFAAEESFPVFAHCRGLQMMNMYMGGGVSRCSGHVATRHPIKWNEGEKGVSEVNSYHDWGVKEADLAEHAEVLATAKDGSIEAITHVRLPWTAIMWHPEREPALRSEDRRIITECLA